VEKPDFIVPPPGLFPSTDDAGQGTARVPRGVPIGDVPLSVDAVGVAPTKAVPTDAVSTDAVSTHAVPTDAVPTDAVLTDFAAIPVFVPTMRGVAPRPAAGGAVVAPARVLGAWSVRLADGQVLPVTGSIVLGRDPAPVTRRASTMVSVSDPALSVSKSHALVELSGDGELFVTDLHSTNGVAVIGASGTRQDLAPGIRTMLPAGSRLMLGEFAVDVARD